MPMPQNKTNSDFELAWPNILRRSAFRQTFLFAVILAVCMCVVALFVSWQTIGYLQTQIDMHLLTDARSIAAEPSSQLSSRLSLALTSDPEGKRVGAIFDRSGRLLAGNLNEPPYPLPAAGSVGPVGEPLGQIPPGKGTIRLGYVPLSDGRLLVFGRRVDELNEVDAIMLRTLAFAALPILIFAVAGGTFLSRLTVGRGRAIEKVCRSITKGNFEERLPVHQRESEFRVFALTINRMLDEIERLMLELKCAGDAMAHDISTPLTRLRARLGRIAEGTADLATAKTAIGQSVADVDQLMAMIRAILRLGEIESGRRRRGFDRLDLAMVIDSVVDFYAPVAEEKNITLTSSLCIRSFVHGDAELLFEAVGNLVDNAIKFTPSHGSIALDMVADEKALVLHIDDSGPGIAADERTTVLRRFYRSDPSRHIPGSGLGLPIAAAILRLHDFGLTLGTSEKTGGCRVAITMRSSSLPIESEPESGRPARAGMWRTIL
jgi:signal transduction histidine kinase